MSEFIAPDGCSYDSPKEYAWIDVLGFCGCYSHSLFDLTFSILEKLYAAKVSNGSYFYDYKDKTEAETDVQELVLHVLDSKDLTEHGSAVRGCWLTDKGLELCRVIFPDDTSREKP